MDVKRIHRLKERHPAWIWRTIASCDVLKVEAHLWQAKGHNVNMWISCNDSTSRGAPGGGELSHGWLLPLAGNPLPSCGLL